MARCHSAGAGWQLVRPDSSVSFFTTNCGNELAPNSASAALPTALGYEPAQLMQKAIDAGLHGLRPLQIWRSVAISGSSRLDAPFLGRIARCGDDLLAVAGDGLCTQIGFKVPRSV